MVVSQNEPQVAIISLEALNTLKEAQIRDASRAFLNTVQRVRELLKDEHLPADLSARHDHYLWDADATDAAESQPQHADHPAHNA